MKIKKIIGSLLLFLVVTANSCIFYQDNMEDPRVLAIKTADTNAVFKVVYVRNFTPFEKKEISMKGSSAEYYGVLYNYHNKERNRDKEEIIIERLNRSDSKAEIFWVESPDGDRVEYEIGNDTLKCNLYDILNRESKGKEPPISSDVVFKFLRKQRPKGYYEMAPGQTKITCHSMNKGKIVIQD